MNPLIAAAGVQAGASLLGGMLGARGTEQATARQIAFNREEAQKNRDFQERMSSSAHQRQVADLRAAGLNPILSATGGSGASSPAGSSAAITRPENKHQAMINAIQSFAGVANSLANTAKVQAETHNIRNLGEGIELTTLPAKIVNKHVLPKVAPALQTAKEAASHIPAIMSPLGGKYLLDRLQDYLPFNIPGLVPIEEIGQPRTPEQK